jgi:integrase
MQSLDAEFDLSGPAAQRHLWTWRRETAWRIVHEAMQRAGVEGCRACPKGLRHGFGVGALQAGVPLNLVQRWLGHARNEHHGHLCRRHRAGRASPRSKILGTSVTLNAIVPSATDGSQRTSRTFVSRVV